MERAAHECVSTLTQSAGDAFQSNFAFDGVTPTADHDGNTYSTAFTNVGADRSVYSQWTIVAADTWELKEITIPASPSGGTWNYTTSVGAYFDCVALALGSSHHGTTADSWESVSSKFGESGQANFLDSTSNELYLSDVRIDLGKQRRNHRGRDYGETMLLCQRYYQTMGVLCLTSAWTTVANAMRFATMRAAPTVTTTPQSGSGAAFAVHNNNLLYQSAGNSVVSGGSVTLESEL